MNSKNIKEESSERGRSKLSVTNICAIITILIVLASSFYNLIYSIYAQGYYNIPMRYFFNDYLSSALNSIPFIIVILFVAWFIYFIKNKESESILEKILDYILAGIVATYILLLIMETFPQAIRLSTGQSIEAYLRINSETRAWIFIALVFLLSFFAMLFLLNHTRKQKTAKKEEKLSGKKLPQLRKLISTIYRFIRISPLVIVFIMLAVSFIGVGSPTPENKTKYEFIEGITENRAILSTYQNQYVTVKYSIRKDDNSSILELDTSRFTLLPIENQSIYMKSFNSVKVKYDLLNN